MTIHVFTLFERRITAPLKFSKPVRKAVAVLIESTNKAGRQPMLVLRFVALFQFQLRAELFPRMARLAPNSRNPSRLLLRQDLIHPPRSLPNSRIFVWKYKCFFCERYFCFFATLNKTRRSFIYASASS